MKVYNTESGILIEDSDQFYLLENRNWDEFINRSGLTDLIRKEIKGSEPLKDADSILKNDILPPVGSQEIWASGVTYYRSRSARMEESQEAGGGDFYDRVYAADRPELFFKSPAYRAVGTRGTVRIRKDSKWDVPEPELTLFINSKGEIQGYTVGNDMSSRSIEGENPLYLPQAKTYDGSAGLGPGIYLLETPAALPQDTEIKMDIVRSGKSVFQESIDLSQMKRKPEVLVEYLYRELTFDHGCFLMTGTGIIPPNEFTLQSGDEITIEISGVGTLVNQVE